MISCFGAVWGCGSEEGVLPEATSDGRNTFGCKINGKVWLANGASNENGPSLKPLEVEFNKLADNRFRLFIVGNANTRDRVQLALTSGVVGDNPLKNRYDDPFAVYYDTQSRIFTSMEANPGKLVITKLDTVNHIISGTFHFDAQFIVNKEIVKVTEGRFDIDLDDL